MFSFGEYKYVHPDTGEVFTFVRRGIYKRDGKILRFLEETKNARSTGSKSSEPDTKEKG